MGRISETELKKQIKEKELSGAYLIFGEETYLKEFYVNKMKAKVVDKAMEDFNFHAFEEKNTSLDEILQCADMLPVMSEYSFVLVHDYPIDKSSSDCDTLKDYLKDLPQSTVLVFWYDSIVFDTKKNSKMKSIENAFSKYATSVNLEKRSENDLTKIIVSFAKKKGTVITPERARYLISVVGSDMKTVLNETEKLCNFVGDKEITKDIIDSIAVKCLAARVYDLSKAIVKNNYEMAYGVLDTLFNQKENPITILSVIISCYVDMYRCKCAKIANKTTDDICSAFNYKGREFAVRNAMRDCSSLSINQLRDSIDVLSVADVKLKSTTIDQKLIIEETMVKLLLISKDLNYA